MKTRVLAVFLLGILLLYTAVPVCAAQGAEGYTTQYEDALFLYELRNDHTAAVTGLTRDGLLEEQLQLPPVILSGTYTVNAVAAGAFRDANVLRTLIVPDSVTEIGEEMCWHCDNLRFVTLPDTVRSIGASAFGMCGQLLEVNLPAALQEISSGLFFACGNLAEIVLPDGLTAIGSDAFRSCRTLRSVCVPEGTRSLGEDAFADCERLNNLILPESLTSVGAGAFRNCGRLKTVTLPAGLQEIADDTFNGCVALTQIAVPEQVVQIGARAFAHCVALREAELFGSPVSLQEECFAYCAALQEIELPPGLASIGARAFYNTALTCRLPVSVVSIGEEAFNAEGTTVLYAGSELQWLHIGIGPGNTGISEIVYGTSFHPSADFTVREGSSLSVETLPGSSVSVVRGLQAGKTAPAVRQLTDDLAVEGGTVTIRDADGTRLTPEAPCGTGCIVEGYSREEETLLAVAYLIVDGDVLGTGQMNIAQLVTVCQAMLGTVSLTPLAFAAVDADSSGRIEITDVVAEARRLAGLS